MQTITVTMTVDQANAVWSIMTQMVDGLELQMVGDRPLWTAMVGKVRVAVGDYDLDQAARGMCTIREQLNAAHRAAADADTVVAKREG